MPITRPRLNSDTERITATIAAEKGQELRAIAQRRLIGMAAIIREAVDCYLAALPSARDTQHPASTPGGDGTPTPADSIRDEADPGGPSAAAAEQEA